MLVGSVLTALSSRLDRQRVCDLPLAWLRRAVRPLRVFKLCPAATAVVLPGSIVTHRYHADQRFDGCAGSRLRLGRRSRLSSTYHRHQLPRHDRGQRHRPADRHFRHRVQPPGARSGRDRPGERDHACCSSSGASPRRRGPWQDERARPDGRRPAIVCGQSPSRSTQWQARSMSASAAGPSSRGAASSIPTTSRRSASWNMPAAS